MSQLMIWLGSGFAFAIGSMLGIVFAGAALKRSNSKNDEFSAQANKHLAERNEIGRDLHQRLIEIRDAIIDHQPKR